MNLRQQQSLFLLLFARLIIWANEQANMSVTAGELHRTDEQHLINRRKKLTKALRSLHQDRLAGDLNLFIKGVYQTKTEAYEPLGKYWNTLHPGCRWGGDWNEDGKMNDGFPDGNHFEFRLPQ